MDLGTALSYSSRRLKEALERRLAAILAADAVGYSRLLGQDEVGTPAILSPPRKETIEPLNAARRAHIVELMGNGVPR